MEIMKLKELGTIQAEDLGLDDGGNDDDESLDYGNKNGYCNSQSDEDDEEDEDSEDDDEDSNDIKFCERFKAIIVSGAAGPSSNFTSKKVRYG